MVAKHSSAVLVSCPTNDNVGGSLAAVVERRNAKPSASRLHERMPNP